MVKYINTNTWIQVCLRKGSIQFSSVIVDDEMRVDRTFPFGLRRNKLSHSHEVEGGRGPACHEDVEDDHNHVQIRIGSDLQCFDFSS